MCVCVCEHVCESRYLKLANHGMYYKLLTNKLTRYAHLVNHMYNLVPARIAELFQPCSQCLAGWRSSADQNSYHVTHKGKLYIAIIKS